MYIIKLQGGLAKVWFKLVFVICVIFQVLMVDCNHYDVHEKHNHGHGFNRKRHRSHHHHQLHQLTNTKPCTEEWNINCPPKIFPDYSSCSMPCPGGRGDGPVCGNDGLMYDSRCILEKEACLIKLRQFGESGTSLRGSSADITTTIGFLEVDESGRKCVHFLELLNQNRVQRYGQSGDDGEKESDGINIATGTTTTEASIRSRYYIQEIGAGPSSPLTGEMQRDQAEKVEKVCTNDDFEVFKGKLFELSEIKRRELTIEKEKMDPRWRRLLADGPEADKDHIIQLIFSNLDQDSNFILNYMELYQGDMGPRLASTKSTLNDNCQWRDFLRFQDSDGDDKIHVTEFYAAFAHLYGVTMISLEKALEWKTLNVAKGSDVPLYCDVVGQPPTMVVWTTPTKEKDPHILHEVDGSLMILGVGQQHEGNFTCKSVRNEEVVQRISLSLIVNSVPNNSFNQSFVSSVAVTNVTSENVDSYEYL